MNAVENHDLPDELARAASRYEDVIGHRSRYLWKWFHVVNPRFQLPTVADEYCRKVRDDKTWLTFYVTMVDDFVDQWDDRATFAEAAKVPFDDQRVRFDRDEVDTAALELIADVWSTVADRLADPPCNAALRDAFYFDLRQVLNAVRYTSVVNRRPAVANLSDAFAYGSHNMAMFPYADVDLFHSPSFSRREIPKLRSMLRTAQEMARIGNWVSTWERELAEADFSSGVLVRALETGQVSPEALREAPATACENLDAAELESFLLAEWDRRYESIRREYQFESFDVDAFLEGMEEVLVFHLESTGNK